jgi:hypothetical protein
MMSLSVRIEGGSLSTASDLGRSSASIDAMPGAAAHPPHPSRDIPLPGPEDGDLTETRVDARRPIP